MDKMISLYSNYLSEICHCYADANSRKWRCEQMFGTKKN